MKNLFKANTYYITAIFLICGIFGYCTLIQDMNFSGFTLAFFIGTLVSVAIETVRYLILNNTSQSKENETKQFNWLVPICGIFGTLLGTLLAAAISMY